eukprot:12733542-Ditylum_brightwellii.AAC.1
MVMMVVLMVVLTVLRSTSYIYHKWLIAVWQIEASKKSILLAMKMMMLAMAMSMGEDDSVGNGDDVDADGAGNYLVHLSQVADCRLTDRSKQNEHLVLEQDKDVDDDADD